MTNAKNRWGNVYPYFYCIGRARHRNCTQPAILITDVEASVTDYWTRVQLSETRIADIREQVMAELTRRQSNNHRELERQKHIKQLQDQQLKLFRGALRRRYSARPSQVRTGAHQPRTGQRTSDRTEALTLARSRHTGAHSTFNGQRLTQDAIQRPHGPLPWEALNPGLLLQDQGSNFETLVELRGIEPLASSMRPRRSAN